MQQLEVDFIRKEPEAFSRILLNDESLSISDKDYVKSLNYTQKSTRKFITETIKNELNEGKCYCNSFSMIRYLHHVQDHEHKDLRYKLIGRVINSDKIELESHRKNSLVPNIASYFIGQYTAFRGKKFGYFRDNLFCPLPDELSKHKLPGYKIPNLVDGSNSLEVREEDQVIAVMKDDALYYDGFKAYEKKIFKNFVLRTTEDNFIFIKTKNELNNILKGILKND